MSTNKTTNLNLHSWIDTDSVDFEEINENFSKLDAASNDYVVDHGSNAYWSWRKWNSGRCELWGTSGQASSSETNVWTQYGSLYYREASSPELPFAVYDIATYISPLSYGSGIYFACPYESAGTVDNYIQFHLVSLTNNVTFAGFIRYFVVGRWK